MKKIKFAKEEDRDHKTLAIFMIIFMSVAICFGTFYFNVICFGTECENKSPAPLVIIKTSKSSTSGAEKTADIVLPEGAKYLRNTEESIKINITSEYYECIDVNIENGQLMAKTAKYLRHFDEQEGKENLELDTSYTSNAKTFSIPDEKVKYIYSMYYQPGANSIVYVLCESGNIYTNNVLAINQNIDVLNDFKKTKHTNVDELVMVPVDIDSENAPDGLPFEIDGLSNGNLSKIEIAY